VDNADCNFQKLTPIHDVDLDIYKNALDFVFENEDIKNIGVSGAYSAGKSSVIESYKKTCPEKHFLHISLAYFEASADVAEKKKNSSEVESKTPENIVNENILEGKILNQLIHQIDAEKIPQTNFRVKRQVSKVTSWGVAISILYFCGAAFYTFRFNEWKQYVDELSITWLKDSLLWSINPVCLFLSYTLMAGLLALLLYNVIQLQKNKNFFKKVSVQGNEIEIFEQNDDSYFDKYLNEVLYLFEKSDADVIVFEDMDRYNANQIFQRLREVNTLINNRRKKKDAAPLRFFYLLRDDIFVSKDRTKFFDFILPVVPILDGSNSYDQLIAHFKAGGLFELFDENFLQGISLYVNDMRILKNSYNEFVIYKKRIGTTEQNANKLLAIIVYKNLFPRDFSDLQLNKGFVFNLFSKKDLFIADEKQLIQNKINEMGKSIQFINNEVLLSENEVDVVYSNPPKVDSYARPLSKYIGEKNSRKQAIRERTDNSIEKFKGEIINLEQQRQLLQNKKLSQIINRGNIESIFQSEYTNEIGETNTFNEIKSSEYFPLLKYLVRNGFVDETYPDYMTYFYENSLGRIDKVFLRSITDEKAKEYTYSLQKPEMVVRRLRIVDFDNEETLNFDLLSFLLQAQLIYHEQLDRLINQLKISKNFDFIGQFISNEKETQSFIKYINHAWPQLFQCILKESSFNDAQKKTFSLLSIYYSSDLDLSEMNSENVLSDFIANCFDFLQIDEPQVARLIEAFELLQVKFVFISYAVANMDLWNAVYSHNLYELNNEMIDTILENQYKLPKCDDYYHKNLSLILSKPKESLVSYIQENIEKYMEIMLARCDNQISDPEETAIYIVNSNEINEAHKGKYIDYLSTHIASLRSINIKAWWPRLIENELLLYSEDNVLNYFFKNDKIFDTVLIQYVNDYAQSFSYIQTSIDKLFGENGGFTFFEAVVQCNSLQNDKYEAILRSLDSRLPSFSIQGINEDKTNVLISLQIITMTFEVLSFMRKNYPNNILLFIVENIEEYVEDVINEESFSLDEALNVLRTDVESTYKIKLLKITKEPISVETTKYTEPVEAYIIENNFEYNDLPYLLQNYDSLSVVSQAVVDKLAVSLIKDILSNEYSISYTLLLKLLANQALQLSDKLELFSLSLPNLNQDQCKKCLKIMKHNDYLSLFDGKRPKFELNDVNEHILLIFKKNGWITKFDLDDDLNVYRAIGRKFHDAQEIPVELL